MKNKELYKELTEGDRFLKGLLLAVALIFIGVTLLICLAN